jgi:hypothetical protein
MIPPLAEKITPYKIHLSISTFQARTGKMPRTPVVEATYLLLGYKVSQAVLLNDRNRQSTNLQPFSLKSRRETSTTTGS